MYSLWSFIAPQHFSKLLERELSFGIDSQSFFEDELIGDWRQAQHLAVLRELFGWKLAVLFDKDGVCFAQRVKIIEFVVVYELV